MSRNMYVHLQISLTCLKEKYLLETALLSLRDTVDFPYISDIVKWLKSMKVLTNILRKRLCMASAMSTLKGECQSD